MNDSPYYNVIQSSYMAMNIGQSTHAWRRDLEQQNLILHNSTLRISWTEDLRKIEKKSALIQSDSGNF